MLRSWRSHLPSGSKSRELEQLHLYPHHFYKYSRLRGKLNCIVVMHGVGLIHLKGEELVGLSGCPLSISLSLSPPPPSPSPAALIHLTRFRHHSSPVIFRFAFAVFARKQKSQRKRFHRFYGTMWVVHELCWRDIETRTDRQGRDRGRGKGDFRSDPPTNRFSSCSKKFGIPDTSFHMVYRRGTSVSRLERSQAAIICCC